MLFTPCRLRRQDEVSILPPTLTAVRQWNVVTAAIRHPLYGKEAANLMTRRSKPRKTTKAIGHKPVDHTKQLPRLRRIEGQVRGLQQMVADDRYCIDIVYQINATIAALRRVQGDMLNEHVAACAESALGGDVKPAEARRLAEEIGRVMTRFR